LRNKIGTSPDDLRRKIKSLQNQVATSSLSAGTVNSVNGQTGTVVLDASSVGAPSLPVPLTDLETTLASENDVITFQGGIWKPAPPTGGGGNSYFPSGW